MSEAIDFDFWRDDPSALGAVLLGRQQRNVRDQLGHGLHTDGREPMSAVREDYRHSSKLIEPATSITLGDSVLKWYDLAPADEPVPPDVQVLARGSLHAAGESGLGLADDLGFVILHRCGESFYFLLVSTWRNDNEVWETVWAKNGEDVTFRPWPREGTHLGTFCVWELGVVWHEQQAWSRFLHSRRGPAARKTYLHDTFEGEV